MTRELRVERSSAALLLTAAAPKPPRYGRLVIHQPPEPPKPARPRAVAAAAGHPSTNGKHPACPRGCGGYHGPEYDCFGSMPPRRGGLTAAASRPRTSRDRMAERVARYWSERQGR